MFVLSTFIEQFLKVKEPDWSPEDQAEADRMFAMFIGGSVYPVHMTDNEDLRVYIKKINPKVSIFCADQN